MSTYRREHYLAKLRPFYNDSGLIKESPASADAANPACSSQFSTSSLSRESLKPISSTSTSIAANTAT